MKPGSPTSLLSKAAAIVAISLLGWNVYYAVDALAPQWLGRDAASPSAVADQASLGSTAGADYDVDDIVAAHLLGEAASEPEHAQPVQAPETKLRLSLVGLIASADSQWARALIEVNQGKAEPYRLGQSIEGTDAKLKSVENTRVLLERGSAVESLAMDWQRLSGLAAGAQSDTSKAN